MAGTVHLQAGETLITGGWELEPGRRGFAFVSPQIQPDGNVLLEARLLALPEDAVATTGLSGLLTPERDAERYSVTEPETTRALFEAFEQTVGADFLSTPRLLTAPGNEATIQVGQTGAGEGIELHFRPHLQPNGSGLDLEMKAALTLPPPTP